VISLCDVLSSNKRVASDVSLIVSHKCGRSFGTTRSRRSASLLARATPSRQTGEGCTQSCGDVISALQRSLHRPCVFGERRRERCGANTRLMPNMMVVLLRLPIRREVVHRGVMGSGGGRIALTLRSPTDLRPWLRFISIHVMMIFFFRRQVVRQVTLWAMVKVGGHHLGGVEQQCTCSP
jgi:hypothetical protein